MVSKFNLNMEFHKRYKNILTASAKKLLFKTN